MEGMEQGVVAATRGGSVGSHIRPAKGRIGWGGLAVLLGVLFLLLSGSRPAQAQFVVSSVPAVLSVPGTYVVSNDLFYAGPGAAIRITASGVTLDFAGHTLTGTYRIGGIGVLVQGPVFGVSITSTPPFGTVRLFATGIELEGSVLGAVQNMAAINDGLGILVNFSLANGIAGNMVRNDGAGIAVKQSFGNVIQQNTVSNDGSFGIWLFNSNSNQILSNIVSNNSRSDGILLEGVNNRNLILSNAVSSNAVGIWVYSGSSLNVLAGNTALPNRVFDLVDANPMCDTNAWVANGFVKANQPCIH